MSAEPTPVDQKEKWRSIGVMRRTDAAGREPALAKDRDAYRRLRHNGLQPATIAGSATLEATADHRHEVEMGHAFPAERFPDRRDTWRKVDEGMERGREMQEWREANDA
jgi:hypothetical protein